MSEVEALLFAHVFGWVYNYLFNKFGMRQNITVFWVAGGIFATLLFSAWPATPGPKLSIYYNGTEILLSNAAHAAIHVLKFFIASGIPMFIGALLRALRDMEND